MFIILFSSKSFGVRDKAANSKDRTNDLYEYSQGAQMVIKDELQPKLRVAKTNIDEVGRKTKATKGAVETISK